MMARSKILPALFILMIIPFTLFAQETLMTIGDKEISLDEFERIYNKNNNSITNNQQTPEEYLDLFINFKLKVLEAENLGMDTTKKFLDEFNGYKEQLAKPYLTDEETRNQLIKEAYERMKYDVHVSHILLSFNSQASPEDTLARYEQAMQIRQRILDGEDFAEVARATSDDPGARINGGDLGFFTVFMMVYPFETAAYNMEVGEISMPVRSNHGYHIIKKHAVRPAVGQIKVAHIFLRTPEGMSPEGQAKAKEMINLLADSLRHGADFAALASKYSDDKNSAMNGGELPWFGTGRMIKDFEQEAFALKSPGDITAPFRSFYGWHIVKLIDKQPIGSFEEMESTLQSRALKGARDRIKRQRYMDKLKDKYSFSKNEEQYMRLYSMIDSSIFEGNWDISNVLAYYDDVLFSVDGEEIKTSVFLKYLDSIQKKRNTIPMENYVDMNFNKFLEEFLIEKEKETLPERYPEYKYILQEYHDGILLFDLMDQKVWTKAIEDTTGLELFFKDHRKNYMWEERMKGFILSCDSTVDMNALLKKSAKITSGKWNTEKLNKKFCSNDSTDCIKREDFLVEKGENEHIDALNGIPGIGKTFKEDGLRKLVILSKKVKPTEKALNETRGQVTSDYQDYLEQEWLKELKKKYDVKVNKSLLSKIE